MGDVVVVAGAELGRVVAGRAARLPGFQWGVVGRGSGCGGGSEGGVEGEEGGCPCERRELHLGLCGWWFFFLGLGSVLGP